MPPTVLPLPSSVREAAGSVRWAALAIVVAVAATYANSVSVPFLFDDMAAVSNNPTIRELGSLEVLQPPADGSTTTGRPLVNLSLALNYAIGGERVTGYHVANIAIHALAALALFGLVRRTLLMTPSATPRDATGLGFAVALIWALHPLQTETVVSIAQRTEALCGLLLLATLYAFARGWRVGAVVFCLLGMATKEVAVVAPVLVLLYDRAFLAGSFRAALVGRAKFYSALAATWLLLAWLLLQGGGTRGIAAGFGLGVTPWDYLLTQADALGRYLKLALWPNELVLDYGTAVAGSLAEVLAPALLVVALLAVSGWACVRRPAAGFVGAWFFIILAPSSSVVPLVTQTIAEHRMYLPLASVIVVVVFGLWRVFRRRFGWAMGAIAVALGATTIARNHDYRDGVTIWTDTIAKRPANPRAHNNLGWALHQEGRLAEANRHYAHAVALDPKYVTARYNWGVALLAENRSAEAIEQLEAALRLTPQHLDARVNLGNALVRAGRAGEAIEHFEHAARQQPDADVHYNLGVAHLAHGDDARAANAFATALQHDPKLPEAYFQLGRIAERRAEAAEAERCFRAALQLNPDHAGAHARLGLLCARSERLEDAAGHFRAVLRMQPDDADAHANLGNVLLLQNQPEAAIASYERALRLRPADARTRENIQLARDALRAAPSFKP